MTASGVGLGLGLGGGSGEGQAAEQTDERRGRRNDDDECG